jgi:hypothetical protein
LNVAEHDTPEAGKIVLPQKGSPAELPVTLWNATFTQTMVSPALMVMFRGTKLVPLIVLVCVAAKTGAAASKDKSAERTVLLKVFIGFLSFKGRIGAAEDAAWKRSQMRFPVLGRRVSLLEGAIEPPVRWRRGAVEFDHPGAWGGLHRVGGPLAVQRLGALQLVAEVAPALAPLRHHQQQGCPK